MASPAKLGHFLELTESAQPVFNFVHNFMLHTPNCGMLVLLYVHKMILLYLFVLLILALYAMKQILECANWYQITLTKYGYSV